jgi:valyl-tRNA synthetase
MSKSKGNVIDPLGIIDDYGADALRFTLARAAAQGHDIKLSPQLVENNRNFATKLWNAARFAEMNDAVLVPGFDPRLATETLNKWIAHELAKAAAEITTAIETYRFNDAAGAAYRFVWNVYCDWYLELVKPVLMGPDGAAKTETRAMVAWVRDEVVKLLHPFMPFITEELWRVTPSAPHPSVLALTAWPVPEGLEKADAEREIGWVVDLVSAIRSVRAEMNIAGGTPIPLVLVEPSADTRARALAWSDTLKRLARLSDVSFAETSPKGAVQLVVRGEVAALPLIGVIDLVAEKARLEKEIAKADADIKRVDAKLGNPDFVARAPEEIIEGEREKREEAESRRAKVLEALERLAQAS